MNSDPFADPSDAADSDAADSGAAGAPTLPERPVPARTDRLRIGAGFEANTSPDTTLGGLYRSLAEFTVLTDCVRAAVDERLARAIEVTGWANGVLRVQLSRPTLATHWRFQEPAVRRALARLPAFRGLTDIRLVLAVPAAANRSTRPRRPGTLGNAPALALRQLARDEPHDRLRHALEALAEAAEQARAGTGAG